ncbi:MAG: hypothetical protein RBT36_02045 [Desulfobulbus sp.]|nr:hypothetical protein [Desulfobulbus sp.]
MRAQAVCAVCGNEIDLVLGQCPYCGAERTALASFETGPPHREVNLEKGMPPVALAMDRLGIELALAAAQGTRVLTLIHGYGSSGEGGAIKLAVLRRLEFLRHTGRVREVVPGEAFEGRSGRGRQLLRRFPFLVSHRDLSRANPGITLVIL